MPITQKRNYALQYFDFFFAIDVIFVNWYSMLNTLQVPTIQLVLNNKTNGNERLCKPAKAFIFSAYKRTFPQTPLTQTTKSGA